MNCVNFKIDQLKFVLLLISYPTIAIYKDGKFLKMYDGKRKADYIVKYMRDLVDPKSSYERNYEQRKPHHTIKRENKSVSVDHSSKPEIV